MNIRDSFINEPMGRFVDLVNENRDPSKRQLLAHVLSMFREARPSVTRSSDKQTIDTFFKWYKERFEKEYIAQVQPHLDFLVKNMYVYLHFVVKDSYLI